MIEKREQIVLGEAGYFVLCERTIQELENTVNQAITKEGYKPVGGVTIFEDRSGIVFLQAIFKLSANVVAVNLRPNSKHAK